MRRFTLTIECENAAFEGDELAPEIARILEAATQRVLTWGFASHRHSLHDTNGNVVGYYQLINDEADD